jgi:hypothetical protein
MKEPKTRNILISLLCISTGLAMLTIAVTPTPILMAHLLFPPGLFFSILGVGLLAIEFQLMEKARRLHEQRMKQADKGIVYVWAVGFLAIAVYSIIWFSLGWPALQVMDTMEAMYPNNEFLGSTVAFIRLIFQWHPILMILGLIAWMYVSSQKREDITYPY